MQKLISIDLKSDFGFFRKPDANNTINLSYNIIHKPAILGVLGSIVGLGGYSQAYEKENEIPLKKGAKRKPLFPEYYEKFKNVPVGIEPLEHEKGNYQKTVIKYSNTVGYANNGSNYLTEEATLIKPSYRIYLLLDLTNEDQTKLFNYLKEGKTEYIPYFGKNEFPVWWEKESFMEYEFEKSETQTESYRIVSIFTIDEENPPVIDFEKEESARRRNPNLGIPFMYFERLPNGFDEELIQYKLDKYVYSNFLYTNELTLDNLYNLENEKYVQLN